MIESILDEAPRPLSSSEILSEINSKFEVEVGGDPIKTINARLTEEMNQNGRNSLFMRSSDINRNKP